MAGVRHKAAGGLEPFMDRVRVLLRQAGVIYADETPPAALCRTPAIQPAETGRPVTLTHQPRGPADRDVVGASQVRGLGVRLRFVLGPPGDTRRRLPGGDRAAAPAGAGLHLVLGTLGGGAGVMSNSWSFCTPVTRAPARPAPHCPHAAGEHTTVSSGLATWRSVEDCAPGCFPRLRPPRSRSDRSRLQGSPGRELRVLGLDNLAHPGIGGAQRGHQRGQILPRGLGRQIGHEPP